MIVKFSGVNLEVEVSPPSRPSVPLLVLAHPHPRMGGDMHNKVIDQLFRRAKEKGWGVARFNFRGVGASTGDYEQGAGETDDFFNVLCWTAARFQRPVEDFTVIGYSFGSWIAAKIAPRIKELKRIVLIAPPVKTMDFSPILETPHSKVVFAAEKDEFSPIEETEKWFSALRPPKKLHVVRDATHFFVAHTTELIRSVLRVIED